PSGRFLYVANSGSYNVSGFSIDSATGRLTAIPGSPFPAPVLPVAPFTPFGPRSLAVSRDNRYLFTADGLARVTSFAIAAGGGLSNIPSANPFYPQPSGLRVSSDGKHLFAVSGDSDRVYALDVDASGKVLTSSNPPFSADINETMLRLEANCARSLLFVPDTLGLIVLRASPQGAMTEVSGLPAPGVDVNSFVVLSPDEKFLFNANQATAKISTLSVSPAGAVALVSGSSLFIGNNGDEDQRPVDIDISRDGAFVYVMNANSTIGVFRVAPDGLLGP